MSTTLGWMRSFAISMAEKRTSPDATADEAERRLGRGIALGLPLVTVAAAIVVGLAVSWGPAILVLAGGALGGTVALLWASLRTLGGDAPLPQDLELLASRTERFSDVSERKRAVLRALKDLEHERAIGKIDADDYEAIASHYRDEAKTILRELDAEVEPYRAKAEELARKHLIRRGLQAGAVPNADPAPKADGSGSTPLVEEEEEDAKVLPRPAAPAQAEVDEDEADFDDVPPARIACSKCATSNEPDAAFCKKCGNALQESSHAEV